MSGLIPAIPAYRKGGALVDQDIYIFDVFVQHVITPPGRWVLEKIGVRHPQDHELAALFIGIAFWAFAVVLGVALVLGR
ncbi:hypothetical protein [Bradyrhizobium cosmicum]|uniref:Uncharacterized protein n=1 Tax=Bradyrhizobium cosmicum TaxID=1404864 RepID=A0AAI8MER2_9BRAD|nr:hypothetical protein [Bradyrhizobium cosmicum]BAL76707.1 hypothetical protein S23_35070 [Bradyrhizobium cosmicum]